MHYSKSLIFCGNCNGDMIIRMGCGLSDQISSRPYRFYAGIFPGVLTQAKLFYLSQYPTGFIPKQILTYPYSIDTKKRSRLDDVRTFMVSSYVRSTGLLLVERGEFNPPLEKWEFKVIPLC